MLGKRSSGKSAKKFLYSHEYRDQKKGEKTSETIFQKHTNSARKNVGKNFGKKGKKSFIIFTRIS